MRLNKAVPVRGTGYDITWRDRGSGACKDVKRHDMADGGSSLKIASWWILATVDTWGQLLCALVGGIGLCGSCQLGIRPIDH